MATKIENIQEFQEQIDELVHLLESIKPELNHIENNWDDLDDLTEYEQRQVTADLLKIDKELTSQHRGVRHLRRTVNRFSHLIGD